MKVFRLRDDVAVLLKAIESVNFRKKINDDDEAYVSICTRQMVFTERFATDIEAIKYFEDVISQMESCND